MIFFLKNCEKKNILLSTKCKKEVKRPWNYKEVVLEPIVFGTRGKNAEHLG